MIDALDSATPPTMAQAQAAKAAGVRMWNGYLATRGNLGLLRPWTQAEFDVVRSVFGVTPLAYCSGWDSPGDVAAVGAAWKVRPCLDVEGGIRGDGAWVDGWLARSPGTGLYGLLSTHGHPAPFRVVAGYPSSGDPVSTWPTGKGGGWPAEPHGWQWAGSHQAFGVEVDACWMDDWFVGGTTGGDSWKVLTESEVHEKVRTWFIAGCGRQPTDGDLANFVAAVHTSGDNLEDVADSVYDSAEGQAWRAYLHAASHPDTDDAELLALKQQLQAVRDTLHSA